MATNRQRRMTVSPMASQARRGRAATCRSSRAPAASAHSFAPWWPWTLTLFEHHPAFPFVIPGLLVYRKYTGVFASARSFAPWPRPPASRTCRGGPRRRSPNALRQAPAQPACRAPFHNSSPSRGPALAIRPARKCYLELNDNLCGDFVLRYFWAPSFCVAGGPSNPAEGR